MFAALTARPATARPDEHEIPVPVPALVRSELVVRAGPDARTAVGLLGAGIAIGLLGTRRPRRVRRQLTGRR